MIGFYLIVWMGGTIISWTGPIGGTPDMCSLTALVMEIELQQRRPEARVECQRRLGPPSKKEKST